MKICFTLKISADPDEMPHDVAFHLGLHCLPKVPVCSYPARNVLLEKTHNIIILSVVLISFVQIILDV